MLIQYNFPHVFYAGSDKVENALVLQAMCEFLVRVNRLYLVQRARNGGTVPSLYRSGVTYERTRWWEPIPALYERGWGDCKSLSSALIAEYQLQKIPCRPTFRWVENADGTLDYHILVQTARGFEDPSKVLGMGDDENRRFYGPGSWGS